MMLDDLRKNWMILVSVVALIIGWTTFESRLNSVEVLAQENKTTLEIVRSIQIDIAVMKKDIEFIKGQVK